MNNNKHTNKKIVELENALDGSTRMIELLRTRTEEMYEEKTNYRRLLRYHSLLLMLMALIAKSSGTTDIDIIVKQNILEYYKAMVKDLMDVKDESNEDEYEYDDCEEFDS